MTLPLFARKFLLDFVETGLAAIFALAFVFPTTLEEGQGVALLFASAVAGAGIAAARRAIPGLLVWLQTKLDIPAE